MFKTHREPTLENFIALHRLNRLNRFLQHRQQHRIIFAHTDAQGMGKIGLAGNDQIAQAQLLHLMGEDEQRVHRRKNLSARDPAQRILQIFHVHQMHIRIIGANVRFIDVPLTTPSVRPLRAAKPSR